MDENQVPQNGSEMSDDDVAASLGFITSLSEGLLPQEDQMGTAEGETIGAPVDGPPAPAAPEGKEVSPETSTDADQEKEITEIRAELEELKAALNENGEEPNKEEDTGTA